MNGYDDSEHYGELGFLKLSNADLWRLNETLSVVDAAILITGNDPSTQAKLYDDDENGVIWGQKTDYEGFEPAFKALKAAILGNKLRADVKHSLRGYSERYDGREDHYYEIVQMPHEETVTYDMLVSRQANYSGDATTSEGKTVLNFAPSDIQTNRRNDLYICKKPNWKETMIAVEDLKSWLKSKQIRPQFFFPDASLEGFRDKNHARYSAKLATAVAAWEAIKVPAPKQSAKQTLEAWIQSNGEKFGIAIDGIVSASKAGDIAAIANWDTKGGATPTSTGDSLPPTKKEEPIENYQHGYGPSEKTIDIEDSDIPF